MKKRLLIVLGAALLVGLSVLLWRLDLPNWQKLDIERIESMSGRTMVYDANDTAVGALQARENRIWTGLSNVPVSVQNAFIAAEDLRFYQHHGVDLHRLMGALWQDIRTLSYAQGGSTITQQLIKVTHLSQAKTLSRKAQEILLALQLERRMDKRHILEAYLNAVYFGHGAYGIEAASNVYFDKSVSDLTLAEGALLAGIIKSPSGYAPHLHPEQAVARRNAILHTMAKHGFITEEQQKKAQDEALHLADNVDKDIQFAWYMDTVLQEAKEVLHLTADEIMSGRYAIYTGLSPDMQSEAEALFQDAARFPDNAADGTEVQAALVALDTASGALRAVLGGRHYDVQMGLNRAVDMRRQPGSAIKPVSTYAAAIDAFGYLPSSFIDDTPRTFSGGYAPKNAGGVSYGRVTLREALSRSLNIATVALADSIGAPALRAYAQRFGLPLDASDTNLSLALGSLTYGVSPAQLAAAYGALANGGRRIQPHAIRRIEDDEGRVIYRAPEDDQQAVSRESAYMITDMLKTAATSGSAKALSASGIPVAGKTGTVAEGKDGTRDIWTVAYTPETVIGVWMGFDNPGPDRAMPGSEGGSGYPARLCATFLGNTQRGTGDFKRPEGVKVALLDGLVLKDAHEVLLSTEQTPSEWTQQELFHPDDMPRRFSKKWAAPAAAQDFRLLSAPGQTPVLAFTPQDADVQYVLMRTCDGKSTEIAVLQGNPGQELRFADTEQDLSRCASYTLLPRNVLLYERGTLVTGPMSASAAYVPGGLLNTIMGVGEAEAPSTPTEVDNLSRQSLFS